MVLKNNYKWICAFTCLSTFVMLYLLMNYNIKILNNIQL